MMRTKHSVASFEAPFFLRSTGELQPAGDYAVDREEELVEQVSFPVWRRVATFIHLPAISVAGFVRQLAPIDPSELELAVVADRPAPAGLHASGTTAHV
jgi:hypothetical protein